MQGSFRRPSKETRSAGSAAPNLPTAQEQFASAPAPASSSTPPPPPPVADGSKYLNLIAADGKSDSAPRSVVVHLHGASDLPRLVQLNRALLAPFATLWLVDGDGNVVGERVTWALRPDTRNPVWNSAQDLRLPLMTYGALKASQLHVELWDHDALLPASPIGHADVPLLSLLSDGNVPVPLLPSPLTLPEAEAASDTPIVNMIKKGLYSLIDQGWDASAAPLPPSAPTVQLRLVGGHPRRKRLYVIRHGESEWNKAQSALDLGSMYAQVDHPLSAEGRKQAEGLAKLLAAATAGGATSAAATATGEAATAAAAAAAAASEAESLREMCESKLVMSSPLTRALQTCLLAMGDVLRARKQSVSLVANARERLNPGSADSFGCALGAEEVMARVVSKTSDLYGGDETVARAAVGGIELDDLEVKSRWWSAGPEAKEGVALRLAAFLQQVQYSEEEVVVLVGHSHYIRELLKANLNPCIAERDPDFAARLRKNKLSNCGVARIDLDFAADGPSIVDVRLLAATELVP